MVKAFCSRKKPPDLCVQSMDILELSSSAVPPGPHQHAHQIVGMTDPRGVLVKKSGTTSWARNYFHVYQFLPSMANCDMCGKDLLWKSSTSTLTDHIRRKHRDVYVAEQRKIAEGAAEQGQSDMSQLAIPGCTTLELIQTSKMALDDAGNMPDPRGILVKKSGTTAWAHNYFHVYQFLQSTANCDLCGKDLQWNSSTSTLTDHMRSKHRDVYDAEQRKKAEGTAKKAEGMAEQKQSGMSQLAIPGCSRNDQELAVLKFIIECGLPKGSSNLMLLNSRRCLKITNTHEFFVRYRREEFVQDYDARAQSQLRTNVHTAAGHFDVGEVCVGEVNYGHSPQRHAGSRYY